MPADMVCCGGSCYGACCCYFMMHLIGCPCLLHMNTRSWVRVKYGIPGQSSRPGSVVGMRYCTFTGFDPTPLQVPADVILEQAEVALRLSDMCAPAPMCPPAAGDCCQDCMATWCCALCAICQEHRELTCRLVQQGGLWGGGVWCVVVGVVERCVRGRCLAPCVGWCQVMYRIRTWVQW